MQNKYTYDQKFKQIDFSQALHELGDFEQCQFEQCNFEGVDLGELNFMNCTFIECNLSNVNLTTTRFQEAEFKGCKMIGFNLEQANPFGLKVKFEQCVLNESSFYNVQLSKTHFNDCQLKNVDFGEANLSQSYFQHCDLQHTIFDQTNLEKANLTSAYNFNINPNENKIKQAKFSKENCIGLLHHLNIKIE